MSRQSFGDWGASLGDGDFASALAALGVAVRRQSLPWPKDLDLAKRLLSWTEAEDEGDTVVSWSVPTPAECAAVPAESCLAAWRPGLIQLEIREAGDLDPVWLSTTLAGAAGVSSSYLRRDRANLPMTWKWPLRIGLAPATAGTDFSHFEQTLALQTRGVGWWPTLTRVATTDRNRNVCDLLVYPVGLGTAVSTLEGGKAPIAAGSILVLGGSDDLAWPDARAALERLREGTGALAAATFDVPVADRPGWMISVVEQLSHDRPLPVALAMATPEGEPRVLLADRRVAERTRVSRQFGQLVARFAQAAVPPEAAEEEKGREVPFEPHERELEKEKSWPGGGDSGRDLEERAAEWAGGPDRSGGWDFGREVEDEAAGPIGGPDRSGGWGSGGDLEEAAEEDPSPIDRSGGGTSRPQPAQPAEREATLHVRTGSMLADRLGLAPGRYATARLAEELASIQGHGYDHESGTASVAAEVAAAVEEQIEQDTVRQDRYILTGIYDRSEPGEPTQLKRAFRAGGTHEIRVRVGAEVKGWIAPTGRVALPEELLPEQQEDYPLTVVFHEPRLLGTPQIAEITLPHRGSSTTASFHLRVPPEHEWVEGRITVAYGNRVLQTALLRGRVCPPGDNPHDFDDRIETEIEAVVRPMANLDGRRRFDAALVLNHDNDHVPGVTRLADDHASFVTSNDIGTEIEWFQQTLAQVAYDRTDFTDGLRGDATVDLLRSLARHGRRLYRHVVQDQVGSDPIIAAEYIQVIATSDEARLPTEFIYDRKAPTNDPPAPLCPNAERALKDGKCVDDCPGGAEEHTVICPLGFWGLKKVLERHAHDPAKARQLRRDQSQYALQSEPRAARAPLPVLRGGQVAASQVVDLGCPGGSQRVHDALVQAISQTAGAPLTSWEDWETGIKTGTQSLLLLLVHTEPEDAGSTMQKLEIGHEKWKSVADLENGTFVAKPGGTAPLVLLLGCETSAPTVSIHSLVSEFRREGAAIVVSSLSKIHAVHAVPVAEEFIAQLSAVAGAKDGPVETFGEVMCRVRRTMLAQGQPMVLGLTAYGDADWRLVPDLP